jgi:alkanesulfonate monooxygenase SsuD/methylene tetrahydromethanopterin reductase-like flavin-dependent oxidoreductase (luciferase family)
MHIGLALPQYDYSVPGESPLRWETLLDQAQRAEALGFDSLWLSDHLFLDIAKYGGTADPHGVFEPLVTLAALARTVTRPRLGTLVMSEVLRPASVLAKALATLDRICDGRLDVGLGAGWYEPEYEAVGMKMPPPRERLERLEEAVTVVKGLLGGGPLTFDGRYHRAVEARNLPPALQEPRPRVFVGGKGDRLIALAAAHADGWNTCWVWTPDAYRARLDVLAAACERADRDPATVWRTLGLYALCGEDDADLERRFERMRVAMPAGVVTESLAEWRVGRLVGTVDEVREQARVWADDLGIETLVLGAGPLPFSVSAPDDVELLAHALMPSFTS